MPNIASGKNAGVRDRVESRQSWLLRLRRREGGVDHRQRLEDPFREEHAGPEK